MLIEVAPIRMEHVGMAMVGIDITANNWSTYYIH